MHKYGDLVIYVRNNVPVNALVIQSQQQADGEHLTVLYLDPALASPLLGGSQVDRATATAFVTPLVEGKTFGWKDIEATADAAQVKTLTHERDGARLRIEQLEGELAALKAKTPDPTASKKSKDSTGKSPAASSEAGDDKQKSA